MEDWILADWQHIIWVIISAIAYYIVIVSVSKVVGLRSFSSLSSFDFVITLSIGALLASTVVSKETSLFEGIAAIITLFSLQIIVSVLRKNIPKFKNVIDNQPLLLMLEGKMLEKNMRKARITEDELKAKLRAHNIHHLSQVDAVVLETSGNISVLHNLNTTAPVSEDILDGVLKEV